MKCANVCGGTVVKMQNRSGDFLARDYTCMLGDLRGSQGSADRSRFIYDT